MSPELAALIGLLAFLWLAGALLTLEVATQERARSAVVVLVSVFWPLTWAVIAWAWVHAPDLDEDASQ